MFESISEASREIDEVVDVFTDETRYSGSRLFPSPPSFYFDHTVIHKMFSTISVSTASYLSWHDEKNADK